MLNFCSNVASLLFFIIFHKLLWQLQQHISMFTKCPYTSTHSNTFLGCMCIWLLIGKTVLISQCPTGVWKYVKQIGVSLSVPNNFIFLFSDDWLHFVAVDVHQPQWRAFCEDWVGAVCISLGRWRLQSVMSQKHDPFKFHFTFHFVFWAEFAWKSNS